MATNNECKIKVGQAHCEYRGKEQSVHFGCRTVPWIQVKGHLLR